MIQRLLCDEWEFAETPLGTNYDDVSGWHPVDVPHDWLIYDVKRHYGYYYDGHAAPIRVTFEDESAVPFDLSNGKLDANVLSDNDQLFQDLWRTYFKAICIKERMNPRKQLQDMPRRYWKYMTEKNGR